MIVDLNPKFRALALAQGITIGSPAWLDGGLHARTGDTGGHAAYGWLHRHQLLAKGPGWQRAVISNYAARPDKYEGAPHRMSGYDNAGRPDGWTPTPVAPEDFHPGPVVAGDLPTGQYVFSNGAKVTGIDPEHFNIRPLLAVFDAAPLTVSRAGGGEMPAREAASAILRALMASQAGMVRGSPYVWPHRSASYIVSNSVESWKRGCLAPEDAAAFHDCIWGVMLPSWEDMKDWPGKGTDRIQVFNNREMWLLPCLFDLLEIAPDPRIRAVATKLATRVEALERAVPGRGTSVTFVDSWPKYLANLTSAMVTTDAHYAAWGIRAMDVAGVLLANDKLREAALAAAQQTKSDPLAKAWAVSAEGEYL